MRFRSGVLAFTALGVLTAAPRAQAIRVPCEDVISELNREAEANEFAEPDPAEVGKKLKTDPQWIERCAETYGRRLGKKAEVTESQEGKDPSEAWEENEPEEIAPEEHAAQGEIYEGKKEEEKPLKPLPGDQREWNPSIDHEWEPTMPQEWEPYIKDDDLPPP